MRKFRTFLEGIVQAIECKRIQLSPQSDPVLITFKLIRKHMFLLLVGTFRTICQNNIPDI